MQIDGEHNDKMYLSKHAFFDGVESRLRKEIKIIETNKDASRSNDYSVNLGALLLDYKEKWFVDILISFLRFIDVKIEPANVNGSILIK